MSESITVQTSELTGLALDWAVLYASYGDGPDWKVSAGVFGTASLRDVRVGMDGIDQVEVFEPYDVSARTGVDPCRAIVAAKLGDTVKIPAELFAGNPNEA